MGFKKFSMMIILKTLLIMASLILLILSLNSNGYHAVSVLLVITLIIQLIEITKFVAKTNTELSRFLNAARFADFSQRFELSAVGSGFEELGQVFTDILSNLQKARNQKESELKRLKALIEHVPIPLVSLHHDNKVTLWNHSARRLFGVNHVTTLEDFSQFGPYLPQYLTQLVMGKRQLIAMEIDGMEYRLSLSCSQLIVNKQQEFLISMHDIQSELDVAQLQAWQELVSVLTHEIMNSITPIASLAHTTVDLVTDMKNNLTTPPHDESLLEDLEDIASATTTIAKRSDGLIKFVTSYRKLTKLPAPNKTTVNINELFEQIEHLAVQNGAKNTTDFKREVIPASLDIVADKEMLEQVLMNLLKNAQDAIDNKTDGVIKLSARLNQRGHVTFEVSDNGIGISPNIIDNLFIPFFTTKADGSGVGLTLTRQIMNAHGGTVHIKNNTDDGVTVKLTF